MSTTEPVKLTRKDFVSSSEPRWCVGCGCYSTLNSIFKTFIASGTPRENFALFSGIGCSSRLPYYSNTYGFHSIHGRAPTLAMGMKMVKPEQSVWIMTGDGDGLAIGGNHFIHLARRNPNIKMILFNNQIYGLTKGQVSPTSPRGTSTKSSPYGSLDRPFQPMTLALGAGATFVARVPDNDNEMLFAAMDAANKHDGVAIIEVLINCVIFNDAAYESLTGKESRADRTIRLEAGKPLLFGKNMDKGIRFRDAKAEVVKVGEGGVPLSEILVHDPSNLNSTYAFMLAEMGDSEMPMPIGIIRSIKDYVYTPYTCKPTPEGYKKAMLGGSAWETSADGTIKVLTKE